MQVNYKRVHPDALVPKFMTPGSAGFDLAPVEDVILTNEPKPLMAMTGLVIAAPRDHMLFITHRSSTPKRWGVTVHNGVVDQDYSGDEDELGLMIRQLWPVDDTTTFPNHIPAGTRIAQGIFIPITRAGFFEVEWMGASRGGFGSTG